MTSPIFDAVFGTRKPLEKLRIPRAVAPVWLVDPATGKARPEYADDYEVWVPAREARATAVAS